MSDKIKRVTPREIAEMLINEQAYQSTLFVLAEEHDAEIERLRARVEVLAELLRPLADAAAHYDPMWGRDDDLEWSTRLTKGHLRKVLAALEAKP
jgi:hypothetical protein